MSAAERVSLEVGDGGVATLTLARADARNAIDAEMVSALDGAVEDCSVRHGLRALLIRAEGPVFSVGGDLHHFHSDLDHLPHELDSMIDLYHEALARLATIPLPVVCAVRGAIAGGGLGLLWCADVTIAAADAKLAAGFIRLGLSGDGGSSWWVPRLVGVARARELLLGGRVLSGTEAAEWGLVTRAVEADQVDAEALGIARELAIGPTIAYGEIRRLLAGAHERELADGLRAEREAMARTGATEDAREGIAAFVEGREPRFAGR